MKITSIRNLKIHCTPFVKTNRHIVKVYDCDVGPYLKEIDVPTPIAYLYYIVCMEVQTTGSLRDGEIISINGIKFSVGRVIDGYYELSTSEIKAGKFDFWQTEMLIERIKCRL